MMTARPGGGSAVALRLTHHVIVLKAQLAGLAGLEDLHPDELYLRPAVLKHLLGGC